MNQRIDASNPVLSDESGYDIQILDGVKTEEHISHLVYGGE